MTTEKNFVKAELVPSFWNLVRELEKLERDEPLKYYATPYQDLHDRIKSALESYEKSTE